MEIEKKEASFESVLLEVGKLGEAVKAMSDSLEAKKEAKKKMVLTNEQDTKIQKELEGKQGVVNFFKALNEGDTKSLKRMSRETYEKHGGFKTLNEGVGADGGYLVPIEFEKEVLRYMEQYSQLRSVANVTQMGTKEKRLNSLTGEPVVNIEGELDVISGTTLTFGEPKLVARKYITYVDYSSEVEEDAETNLDSLIVERVARAIAKAEQTTFINSAFSGGEGFLTVAGTTNVELISGTGFTDVTWEDLAAMDAALGEIDEVDVEQAVYIMSRSVYNVLRTKKTSGSGEFFLPSAPTQAMPPVAWGHRILIVNQMPTVEESASGTKFVTLMNPKLHLHIGDRAGIKVKLLEEGTVGDVNLAEQDARALRIRKRTANTTALQNGIVNLATN